MGYIKQAEDFLKGNNLDLSMFEDIEDAALGNGGLGRLAACFLDSAATQSIPLDGYGIRYRYGLFKQYFENGFQKETIDNWQSYGDPWSVCHEDERVIISFPDHEVYAVPYDTPVIGYGAKTINNLRLWQSEPICPFDFNQFNAQRYDEAQKERNAAENISSILYPNDDTERGKELRLKQQYFFSSASLQDLIRKYKKNYGSDFTHFAESFAIQLNDTHPVVSIPELVRLLVEKEGVEFEEAFTIAKHVFAYTNHTVLGEALEKWSIELFQRVLPKVYEYVVLINSQLEQELCNRGVKQEDMWRYHIIGDGTIYMVNLAIYCSYSVNGVAKIHTSILRHKTLNHWYNVYPERFNNKTNGITQRRWLYLANRELSQLITDKIGDGWLTDLSKLKGLSEYMDDEEFLRRLSEVKHLKKQQLAEYIMKKENAIINPEFIFDIQVKRIHEYKRQLLNALSILDIYFGIKEGRIKHINPTAYIFGGKAAPGYYRAKGIIKLINEIASLIDSDEQVKDKLKIVFVSNYNVSYAEKIMPAADISEQISTAGMEASGTGNMKFMLNGALTMGTYDGANIEIVEQSGFENNYIFGARVEELDSIRESYSSRNLYESNLRIKRVLDSLVDGTFYDGGTGMFRELYNSILDGASWHRPDHYFLLYDFMSYSEAREKANKEYSDFMGHQKKVLANIANAGTFSSDRTIKEYAEEIWGL
jgi:starch phosphorylase